MSQRSSVGDLVPRDITEILARESKANKAKRKHGGSFSRAFGWLRGSRRKKDVAGNVADNGVQRGERTRESQMGKQGQHQPDASKAAPKTEDDRRLTVHYQVAPHYQENVFIEGNRPQYLKDLHTEAQEGLKILQQEESKNGLDYSDSQSISSGATLQPDGGMQERKSLLESQSTNCESTSTVSNTRPTLTRQGSTFKPLSPVKKLDRSKKRSRRTTIMGIPHHVQKELGLQRRHLIPDHPIGNGTTPDIVIIPTFDGEILSSNQEGARVHLQDLEVLQSSREDQILKGHIQAFYKDDLVLSHRCGPIQRPKSLAVPGLTTNSMLQEPQGPVMSISPQATYMSKIIPNAILPAEVDVIEISRDRSRSSVRTVGKSSVPSASPASSRSTVPRGPSPGGSNWSHSQSSETIISNSSTISSKGNSTNQGPSSSEGAVGCIRQTTPPDRVSLGSSASWASSASTGAKQRAGSVSRNTLEGDDGESKGCENSFRSLSVMKTKLPPAPPRRTFSLHLEKLTSRSQEVATLNDFENSKEVGAVVEILSPSFPVSPANFPNCRLVDDSSSLLPPEQSNTTDMSSSDSSPQKMASFEAKFERTMSPSSGYSSQSGTPTLSTKEIYSTSPGKKLKPPKPERTGSRLSPPVSISSSLTSLSSAVSETAHHNVLANGLLKNIPIVSHSVAVVDKDATHSTSTVSLRDAFNIPPPPKVQAPMPPPPETWKHNEQTLQLLCGSKRVVNKCATTQRQQPKDSPEGTHCREPCPAVEESKQSTPNEFMEEYDKPSLECAIDSNNERIENVTMCKEQAHLQIEKQKLTDGSMELKDLEADSVKVEHTKRSKKEPPPVMRKNISMIQRKRIEQNFQSTLNKVLPDVQIQYIPVKNSSSQEAVVIQDKTLQVSESFLPCLKTLSVDNPKCSSVSPPPSPPPAHQPPPPPCKQDSPSSTKIRLENHTITESLWPPPPPPVEETILGIFDGQDEADFPPPPPILQDALENCLNRTKMLEVSEDPVIQHEESQSSANNSMAEKECKDTSLIQAATQERTDNSVPLSHLESCTKPLETMLLVREAPLPLPEGVPPPPQEAPPPPPTAQPALINATGASSIHVPLELLTPEDQQTYVNFKRPPNVVIREVKSRDQLAQTSTIPAPKEDANIPLVTPSLLQMVRLRSVSIVEEPIRDTSESTKNKEGSPSSEEQVQPQTQSQIIPQKPIRKSLSLKSSPSAGTTSMRLQEAIRMKTAAMTSKDKFQTRPNVRSLVSSTTCGGGEPVSPRLSDGSDILRSPASTASFIFSKSTKKVVIETPSTLEAQSSLKLNLVAELKQVSDSATNGRNVNIDQTRSSKVPPPIAKKPELGLNREDRAVNQTIKMEGSPL